MSRENGWSWIVLHGLGFTGLEDVGPPPPPPSSYTSESACAPPAGAGVFVETVSEALPNNSLITTVSSTQHLTPNIRCLSGSSKARVGRIIGPLGNDITFLTSDPFLIARGTSADPGTMFMRTQLQLDLNNTGIYTYRTPDENADTIDFNFGIYLHDYAGKSITILLHKFSITSAQTLPSVLTWTMSLLRASTHSPVSHMAPHPPKSCGREMERGYTRTTPTSSSVRFWWNVPAPLITTPSPSMAPLKMWWESTPVLSATPWGLQMNSSKLSKVNFLRYSSCKGHAI